MTERDIIRQRDKISSQIIKYVPLVRPFLELPISLREYSRKLLDFHVAEKFRRRQELIRGVITKKIQRLLGSDAEQEMRVTFSDHLAYNIVDHHQVLNHPLLVPSNIISSVSKIGAKDPQDAIIVISSGDVPPNGYFSKSGFQFCGIRIPLFSVSEREYCSYYIPKRNFNFIERLQAIDRWVAFSAKEQDFLHEFQNFFNAIDFSLCENYNDQITLIVQQTWPLMFEEKLRAHLPNLIYITQEELTSECLISLLQEDTYIYSTLFNPEFRQHVLDNFRGIVVTWNESAGKGTHFFWRKHPKEPRSLRMYLQGNKLVPEDSRMAHLGFELEPETVKDLLRRREIYPSLFLIFSVLNFYAGVKPFMGYGSIVYLVYFRDAWAKTLREFHKEDEAELVESVDLNGLICGIPLFFQRRAEKLQTLYAADIIYNGGVKDDYLEKIFNMPFNELFSIGIPGVYDYYAAKYVPEKERIKPTISSDDLATLVLPWL